MGRLGLLLTLLLAAALGGCAEAPPPVRTPDGQRPVHVVFFLIDTLRADRLGTYGYPEDTSPFVDALAAESVVFENAHAAAPWTLPSVVSLMTSTFLPQHGVVIDNQRLDPSVPTLAQRLKERGYATCSVFHNPYAGPRSGLDKGFDVVQQADRHVDGAHVEEWLDAVPSHPFFLYLHNTVPHDPYEPHPRFLAPFGEVPEDVQAEITALQKEYRALTRQNNRLRHGAQVPDNSPEQSEYLERLDARRDAIETLYEGEVRQADDYVRQVVEALQAGGVWDDTLFVLLSDHGEELGEHGGWEHDQSVYEELLRVPLIVRFPDGAHGGRRVSTPVSLVDVMPTVLDAVGLSDAAAGCVGRSLLPLLAGEDGFSGPRVTGYRWNLKKLFTPWKEARGDENVVVREGTWKAIWNVETDTLELYDLERDPGETTDLAVREPERAERLLEFARRRRDELLASGVARASENTQEISPEERARLQALGYLSEDE